MHETLPEIKRVVRANSVSSARWTVRQRYTGCDFHRACATEKTARVAKLFNSSLETIITRSSLAFYSPKLTLQAACSMTMKRNTVSLLCDIF